MRCIREVSLATVPRTMARISGSRAILGVRTDFGRDHDDEIAAAMEKTSKYWKTPDQGASTTMVAALDPTLDGENHLQRI